MCAVNTQLRRKGVHTLPVNLRRKYGLDEDDVFTLEDLRDSSFLLIPQVSKVAHRGDRAAAAMAEEGVSLEKVHEALDRKRADYYQEHYVQPWSLFHTSALFAVIVSASRACYFLLKQGRSPSPYASR